MNQIEHSKIVLGWLRQRTDKVILFYSGGKDSLVLLDLCSQIFDKVYCVFMFFLPDMEHCKPFLSWATTRYKNTELIELPHWMTSQYLKHNYFSFAASIGNERKIKVLKQVDIENKAKELTGLEYIVMGHKQADSLNRRLMLKGYLFDAINEKGKKIYPLSTWNKAQVKGYINIKRLLKPVEYGIQNSNGLDLKEEVLVFLRDNYPADLRKVLDIFPIAGKILFEYDYGRKEQVSEVCNGAME